MRGRRLWLVLSGLVVVATIGFGAFFAGSQSPLPWWTGEGDHTHTFNDLADREDFIVVYPTQRLFANALNCWNSADPREQQRHAGDPALIAGVVQEVVEDHHADPAQVHVSGASSGAGTAVILAATYPELFATVTSVAGGEYGLNQVDPDDPDATPTTYTAGQAWAQMGPRARTVPLLAIQGEDDDIVPTLAATRLIEQWEGIADLIDDGLANRSINPYVNVERKPASSSPHASTFSTFRDGAGATIAESHLVDGMGHAWPGPRGDGLFTDREDLTRAL